MVIAPGLFLVLANRCAPEVAPATLAAVAGAESSFNTLAIHDNTTGRNVTAPSASRAAIIAKRLIAAGHSVDLGVMQIDSANLHRLGLSVHGAFDACASVRAAGVLLSHDYQPGRGGRGQQAALLAALSRYNTGNAWRGLQNGYVQRVVAAAKQVVPAISPAVHVPAAGHGNQANRQARPRWQVFAPSTVRRHSASPKPHSPRAPSWDVFPKSEGPAGYAREHAVTLSAHRLSNPAGSKQLQGQEPRVEKDKG